MSHLKDWENIFISQESMARVTIRLTSESYLKPSGIILVAKIIGAQNTEIKWWFIYFCEVTSEEHKYSKEMGISR